jgi:hypothetical protein
MYIHYQMDEGYWNDDEWTLAAHEWRVQTEMDTAQAAEFYNSALDSLEEWEEYQQMIERSIQQVRELKQKLKADLARVKKRVTRWENIHQKWQEHRAITQYLNQIIKQ